MVVSGKMNIASLILSVRKKSTDSLFFYVGETGKQKLVNSSYTMQELSLKYKNK